MSLTGWLIVFYSTVLMVDWITFLKGRKTLGIGIAVLICLSLAALCLLWVMSPI